MRELLYGPDDILRQRSEPVLEFGSALTQVIDDMTYVMRGLTITATGITAVQIGVHKRISLLEMNWRSKKKGKPLVMVNQTVMNREGSSTIDEGCLSFPRNFYKIERPSLVRVKYWNEEGREKTGFFHEIMARCVLHEIDHMDGLLYTDRAKLQGIELKEAL